MASGERRILHVLFGPVSSLNPFFGRSEFRNLWRHHALSSSALAALGIERLILVALAPANETIHFVCIVRLLAYGLIIWAIVDKNRSLSSGSLALAERLDQSVKRCECKLAASAEPTFTFRSSALGRARSARSFAV
jgi:hypothetical protein